MPDDRVRLVRKVNGNQEVRIKTVDLLDLGPAGVFAVLEEHGITAGDVGSPVQKAGHYVIPIRKGQDE